MSNNICTNSPNRRRRSVVIVIVNVLLFYSLLLVALTGCQKKQRVNNRCIIGNDTLSNEQLLALDPGNADTTIKYWNACMRLLLAEGVPDTGDESLVHSFSDRLLLLSGTEWNQASASLLLCATRRIAERKDTSSLCEYARRIADSVCTVLYQHQKAPLPLVCSTTTTLCDSSYTTYRKRATAIIRNLLGTGDEIAELCYEFVFTTNNLTSASDTPLTSPENSIRGLIASSEPPDNRKKTSSHHPPAAFKRSSTMSPPSQIPNSVTAQVLDFRDEHSIRDSIMRHIPNIRQLYKKSLKTDANTEGTIIVTFNVAPDGSVLKVHHRSSNIDNGEFTGQFLEYVTSVRFKPVPDKAGIMIFDFPFEFSPEM